MIRVFFVSDAYDLPGRHPRKSSEHRQIADSTKKHLVWTGYVYKTLRKAREKANTFPKAVVLDYRGNPNGVAVHSKGLPVPQELRKHCSFTA